MAFYEVLAKALKDKDDWVPLPDGQILSLWDGSLTRPNSSGIIEYTRPPLEPSRRHPQGRPEQKIRELPNGAKYIDIPGGK